MGFFNLGLGTGSAGGSSGGTNGVAATNATSATFNFMGGDGKILSAVTVDPVTKQAVYTKTFSSADVGQNTIQTRFTGDSTYKAGSLDLFQSNVADANGANSGTAVIATVNQIVAGTGIYISAPNGQGVVTISTSPIDLATNTEDLYDVNWTKSWSTNTSYSQGEFVAVGNNGVNFRSRDGHNWVKMQTYSTSSQISFNCVNGYRSAQLVPFYNNIVYFGVYTDPNTYDNRALVGFDDGPNGIDGMVNDYAIVDQSGPISGGLNLQFFMLKDGIASVLVGARYIYEGWDVNVGGSTITTRFTHYSPSQFYTSAASNATQATNNATVVACYRNIDPLTGQYVLGGGILTGTLNSQYFINNWTTTTSSTLYSLNTVSYGNNVFIAAGTNNSIYISSDGTNWFQRTGAIPGAEWYYMTYGNGKFVCVGNLTINGQSQGVIQYSTDNGNTWVKGNPGTTSQFYGLSYSPDLNVFVAVGAGGAIVSVNG